MAENSGIELNLQKNKLASTAALNSFFALILCFSILEIVYLFCLCSKTIFLTTEFLIKNAKYPFSLEKTSNNFKEINSPISKFHLPVIASIPFTFLKFDFFGRLFELSDVRVVFVTQGGFPKTNNSCLLICFLICIKSKSNTLQ